MTIASFTLFPACSISLVASSRDTPVTSITIRWLEGRADVGRSARSSDSDYKVFCVDAVLVHRERAVLDDVFGALLRAREGGQAAGYHALHHLRIGAEGRGTLACVQHSQSA